MKKFILIFLILCLLPLSVFGQAKDVKDSFGTSGNWGIVVQDTTAIYAKGNSAYVEWIKSMHPTSFVLIDTSWMDDATYDGVTNWDELDWVFIGANTGAETVPDTSILHGIGDVANIIIGEYQWWDDFGFFAENGNSASMDSAIFVNWDSTFVHMAADSDSVTIVDDTEYTTKKFGGVSHLVNVVAFSQDYNDTLMVVDTLDGRHRIAFDASSTLVYWSFQAGSSYGMGLGFASVAERAVAVWNGTLSDSLFDYVVFYGETAEASIFQWGISSIKWLTTYLRSHGHTVYYVDTSDGDLATFTYYGKSVDFDTMDVVLVGNGIAGSTADVTWLTPTLAAGVPGFTTDRIVAEGAFGITGSGGSTESNPTTVEVDSMRIVQTDSWIVRNFTLMDTLVMTDSHSDRVLGQWGHSFVNTISGGTSIATHTVVGQDWNYSIWIHSNSSRNLFLGYENTTPGNGYPTANYYSVIDSSMLWLFSTLPQEPSEVTLTALSPDSMEISWTDNSDSEDGYVVFVHNPDSAYYSSVTADVVKDTIFYIWPPNSKVTADVAVFTGTDTVFSATGKQTAYSDAAVSESPRIWNKSPTENYYSLGGYGLEDTFIDSNYTSNPTWVVFSGTWGVIGPDYWVESRAASGKLYISYEHSTSMFKDSYVSIDFQMSDTTYLDQQIVRFYCLSSSGNFNSTGYFVEIDSTSLTFERYNGVSEVVLITYIWDRDFHWHNIKLKYDWSKSPQDSSVIWTVYYDGDSVGVSTDDTYTPYLGEALGVSANVAGIHFDNLLVYGITPGANHPNTPFALQEKNSGKYVDFDTGTLESGATWGYYTDFGSFTGGTLTGLTANTAYIFRFKAKSGWTK